MAAVAVLAFLVFLPALRAGFVWDDQANFIDNHGYRGLDLRHLRWMFSTFHMGHYIPLTWITLGVDYLLWGMNPAGYHLTSLLLHVATTVVFYLVTLRLLGLAVSGRPAPADARVRLASAFAALLFAIHPLRVESVAWATERRDVLSGLFFLLAILGYLRACEAAGAGQARRRWLAAAAGAFVLALLSKAIVITLPVVLVALDAYPLRRLNPPARGVWAEKLPFFLLALAGAVTAFVVSISTAPLIPLEERGVMARLAQAGFGLVFYLWKTVVPVGLSPLYALPASLSPLETPFLLSSTVVLVVTGGALAAWRRFPAGLVIWASYAALLSPVLQLTHQGAAIVADRYSYLSCLGWAILAGAGLLALLRAWEGGRTGRLLVTLAIALTVLVVGVLGSLTWRQAGVWHDSERLWGHVLAIDPKIPVAHSNLGLVLAQQGKLDEAIKHYQQALQIRPTYSDARVNLGVALFIQGKLDEAIKRYRQALQIQPNDAITHSNLGVALVRQGKLDEAIKHHQQALQIQPGKADAHYNLGLALGEVGSLKAAIASYRTALNIAPKDWPHRQSVQQKLNETLDRLRKGSEEYR